METNRAKEATVTEFAWFFRSPFFSLRNISLCVVVTVLVTAPLVYALFPNYLVGHLAQIPAVLLGAWYARKFRLLERYPLPLERLALLTAFLMPLANMFFLKSFRKFLLSGHLALEMFRPTVLLLIACAVLAAFRGRRAGWPLLLALAFWSALVSWLAATAFSELPLVSAADGYFDAIAVFMALYVFTVIGRRDLIVDALGLFLGGAVTVSVALVAAVLTITPGPSFLLGFPILPSDFLAVKRSVEFLVDVGGNVYENPDFYISLWIMLIPVLVGMYYATTRYRTAMLVIVSTVVYAGLLELSRAGTLVVIVAMLGFVVARFLALRRISALPLSIAVIFSLMTFLGMSGYFGSAYDQYARTMESSQMHGPGLFQVDPGSPIMVHGDGDISGEIRALAAKLALETAEKHPFVGLGYGVYARTVSSIPPHNKLLDRLTSGGILAGISLLLMTAYVYWNAFLLVLRPERDMLRVGAVLALAAFLTKAIPFDAAFSLNGIVLWAFLIGLLLALVSTRNDASPHR